MLNFYFKENFRLFQCSPKNKSPIIKKGMDWRDSRVHLNFESADRIMSTGGYVGAWIPENFVIIDVDMNHVDKEGKPKPDGLKPFKILCSELGITKDLFKSTLVIKTGSGGYHLYFKTKEKITQRSIAESVDIRTHSGYVIASGSSGYSVYHKADVAKLPEELENYMKSHAADKAKPFNPDRCLPKEKLKKVLDKLDVKKFNTNDLWFEFMLSCIATAGNSPEVLDLLADWSYTDINYAGDVSVRNRLETLSPSGGITPATFIFILKREDISKYMIHQIRKDIGAEFKTVSNMSENHTVPFVVDYSKVFEHEQLMQSFYYLKNQASGSRLFVELAKDNLIYSKNEKLFYFFDGNRWIESDGILEVLYAVLLHAGEVFYLEKSSKNDADGDELLSEYMHFIAPVGLRQKIEIEVKQAHDIVLNNPMWDSPELEGTLTLSDGVIDFKGRDIIYRNGEREELRQKFVDITIEAFKECAYPEHFDRFMKNVFPNNETRNTAMVALSTMISGTGKFRKFQIWNGAGSNGKSTLMEIMKSVIGDRAATYKADVLLQKQSFSPSTGPNPDLEQFRGALVAMAAETEEGKKISQGTVKQLTGNEKMIVNPKYKGIITFHTTFQLVLATNYLPNFSAHDNAFVNRLLVIPFYTAFCDTEEERAIWRKKGARYFHETEDIEELKSKIKAERAGVLRVLVETYMRIEKNGIPESKECLELKNNYIESNDDIGKFFEDFCEYSVSPKEEAPHLNRQSYFFTPTKDIVDFFNTENNTRYSAKFVQMRLKEQFPGVESYSKSINGKLTRGLKHIRLKYGAYPEGYGGNHSVEEIRLIESQLSEGNKSLNYGEF